MADAPQKFVSRAGAKLEHALEEFKVDVTGLDCADFGCNVGGFTDCLLQRGARHVTAVDTGYGALAWKLRQDPRVETRERTNALHAEPPPGGVDLVVVDLAWTPQRLAMPAALRWLRPGGRIITLVKPHYELRDEEKAWLDRGFLPHERVPGVVARVEAEMPAMGLRVTGSVQSPLVGGKTSKKAGVPGNVEWLTMVERAVSPTPPAAGPGPGR